MEILWEDADLLAVNKPVGLVVDSGGEGPDLVNSVRALDSGGRGAAFAFHRLDKDTSGIVLLGKTRKFAREMTTMFEEKRIRKAYLAVVKGEWTHSKVEVPIEGDEATTTFRRLALEGQATSLGGAASLIEALPKTGRTHQIRIHCASVGHAILGDLKYGDGGAADREASGANGHALHAYKLDFRHPRDGRAITVKSEPREWPKTWLKDLDVNVWMKLFSGRAQK